jgi:hypothetical protein
MFPCFILQFTTSITMEKINCWRGEWIEGAPVTTTKTDLLGGLEEISKINLVVFVFWIVDFIDQ